MGPSNVDLDDARAITKASIERLATLCKSDPRLTKPLSYLLGAAYSVQMLQRPVVQDGNDPEDLMRLADELARGECRTSGLWLHVYWINNAIHRLASSFERLSKAIGYDRSVAKTIEQRQEEAERWFEGERRKHVRNRSHMGVVWTAANKQKHEFTAPEDERVTVVDERIILGALHTVLELALQHPSAIARSYEHLVHGTPRT